MPQIYLPSVLLTYVLHLLSYFSPPPGPSLEKNPAAIKILHGVVLVSVSQKSRNLLLVVASMIDMEWSHADASLFPSRCRLTCPVFDMCGTVDIT